MAAGGTTRTRRPWAGFFRPLLATSTGLLIIVTCLGPCSVAGAANSSAVQLRQRSASRTVTTPSWWQGGSCDSANYPGSHPLGASWHGLVACGPGPTQGGSDHLVSFYPGAWGELEWECVELSMRWMYLAWGVNPYPADGWDVVRNYNFANDKATYNPAGPQLIVVSNGTVGAVPQPGDVISVARTIQDGFGHTDVVTANAVDAEGNGTITVIQQNGGAGNNGWATYPVSHWTVGDGVSGWLHDPAWSFQRPVVGYGGSNGFEARIAAPGNSYEVLAAGESAVAVSGGNGAMGTNGVAIFGYVDSKGDFYVKRGSSANWSLAAQHAESIALAVSGSGAPVLAYLSTSGDFYARQGSLTGAFTLETKDASSIAVAGGGIGAPLLGYVQSQSAAFFVKTGVSTRQWTDVEPSGVRSIALAEGSTTSADLLGYLSQRGTFFAKQLGGNGSWIKEATAVTSISLALVGQSNQPLLGYLRGNSFYSAEGVNPARWVDEATGIVQMAVASNLMQGALPVLGCVTATGELEVLQGPLSASFSLQARGVTSLALSSVTDS